MNIIIENLRKTFGEKVAVDIEEYRINAGEILGLVGNNGAGKSTLFRLILDLIKADTGRVLMEAGDPPRPSLKGRENESPHKDYDKAERPLPLREGRGGSSIDVAQTEDWKDWTGAFIDESFLIDYLTPDEYLRFVARISGMADGQLEEELKKYEHFMAGELIGQKKLIRNLSAGNKQKVGIVAAMLLRPQVLILDEPFNFLDPSSQSHIKHLLVEYNRETGATILISSHNLQHTVDICPRIALLEDGHILRDIQNTDGEARQELENYFDISE